MTAAPIRRPDPLAGASCRSGATPVRSTTQPVRRIGEPDEGAQHRDVDMDLRQLAAGHAGEPRIGANRPRGRLDDGLDEPVPFAVAGLPVDEVLHQALLGEEPRHRVEVFLRRG